MGKGFAVGSQVDDPFAADQLQAETGLLGSLAFDRFEEERDFLFRFESGVQGISSDGADSLSSCNDVFWRGRAPILQNRGGTGNRIAAKVMGEVEKVGSENPEVEAAAAVVLLSSASNLEQFPDFSFGDQFPQNWQGRVVSVAMGDRQSRSVLLASGDDLVGFVKVPNKGFLDVDSPSSGFGGSDSHRCMLIDMSRGHCDNVRRYLGKHFFVALEGRSGVELEAPTSLFPSIRHRVGYRDDLCSVHLLPDRIQLMSIVPSAGMPDDGDAESGVALCDKFRRMNKNSGSKGRRTGKECSSLIWHGVEAKASLQSPSDSS